MLMGDAVGNLDFGRGWGGEDSGSSAWVFYLVFKCSTELIT